MILQVCATGPRTTLGNGMSSPLLASWQNFYVIIGSASAALTGLQFIAITLLAQTRTPGTMREVHAFGTPTVVQFCTALLVSALATMPWQTATAFGISLGVSGSVGIIYAIRVVWHARKASYKPDFEDWLWYTALPIAAYLALVATALVLPRNLNRALFGLAADTLIFLFIGIHNAWDTVTYIAVTHGKQPTDTEATGGV